MGSRSRSNQPPNNGSGKRSHGTSKTGGLQPAVTISACRSLDHVLVTARLVELALGASFELMGGDAHSHEAASKGNSGCRGCALISRSSSVQDQDVRFALWHADIAFEEIRVYLDQPPASDILHVGEALLEVAFQTDGFMGFALACESALVSGPHCQWDPFWDALLMLALETGANDALVDHLWQMRSEGSSIPSYDASYIAIENATYAAHALCQEAEKALRSRIHEEIAL